MTDEIIAKSIVIQAQIESVDHICMVEQSYYERLVYSSVLTKEQFTAILYQRLESVKQNILSQLYGEKP